MPRWVLHVDLDQFIAAVEVLRRPELAGRPVVVGGDGDPAKRGVVATASYEARAFGVHSGQPLRTALKRCPDAVFLPVDKPAYEAVSDDVMATLREFGTVEVLGWDEAFVDAGEAGDADPEGTARRIQRRVRAATELDCTVGIGENKLQAKLATGFGKPAGVATLTYDSWFDVLGDRPADALWGVGAKTAKKLAELDIHTVRDLAGTHPDTVAARFGPTIGPWLVRVARGVASARVSGEPWLARSRGREFTYQQNLEDWEEVAREVARLAHEVAGEVVAEGRPAVRVVVKVRHAPFFTSTHGHKLPEPTSDGDALAAAALVALARFTDRRPVRLLGVRAEFAG